MANNDRRQELSETPLQGVTSLRHQPLMFGFDNSFFFPSFCFYRFTLARKKKDKKTTKGKRFTSGEMINSRTSTPPQSLELPPIDPARERYPFCVVWTPIPVLSWLLPMIGHMGICDSEGVIHDFAGPYFIGVDHMLFGDPVKYWNLAPEMFAKLAPLMGVTHASITQQYDKAIQSTTEYYRQTQMYNFFTNNCHSYVAHVMEAANVKRTSWNMLKLTLYMMLFGRYISFTRFLRAHLPFIVIVIIAVAVSFSTKLA